jgi:hypothetical protein
VNGVSIAQLVDVAAHLQVSVPAELGGCIVLAAADQLVSRPLELAPSQLMLFEDGILRITGGTSSDETTAESRLRELLGSLLRGACAATPALLRAARRSSAGDMRAFVRELEIALVPTNRGAAKRALARLCRDVSRVIQRQPKAEVEPVKGAEQSLQSSESGQASLEIQVLEEVSRSIDVPNIPDLEIPISVVRSLGDCSDAVECPECANNFWAYLPTETTEADPDCFELSDADLLDDIESVQCPDVELDIVYAAELGIDDFTTKATIEMTEPFPLIRVAKASEPAPDESARVAHSNRSSSLRSIMQFGAKDPDCTDLEVATAVEWVDDLRNCHCPKMETTDLPSSDTESSKVQKGSSAEDTSTRSPHPSSEVRLPVSGPHQFVAGACFAKKASRVTERVSQFGQNDDTESSDLLDRLHRIVSGNTFLTGELHVGVGADGGSSNDHRPDIGHGLTLPSARSLG